MKKAILVLLILTSLAGILWCFTQDAQEGPQEALEAPLAVQPTPEPSKPPEAPKKVKIVEQYTFKGQWVALYEDGIWRTEDNSKNLVLLQEPLLSEVKEAGKKFREKGIQGKP